MLPMVSGIAQRTLRWDRKVDVIGQATLACPAQAANATEHCDGVGYMSEVGDVTVVKAALCLSLVASAPFVSAQPTTRRNAECSGLVHR